MTRQIHYPGSGCRVVRRSRAGMRRLRAEGGRRSLIRAMVLAPDRQRDRGGAAWKARVGTVAGAAIGAACSPCGGAAMDDLTTSAAPMPRRCRRSKAGRPGAPVAWRNLDPGRYGSIVPGSGLLPRTA